MNSDRLESATESKLALLLSFDHAHFFGAAEDFIACPALHGVAKGPGIAGSMRTAFNPT